MTEKMSLSEKKTSQQSSDGQNIYQDIGSNSGQIQGVIAGEDANANQGKWNFIFSKILSFTFNIFKQESVLGKQKQRSDKERSMLLAVSNEVESRLSRSLHKKVPILLDKKEDPSKVNHPWAIDVKIGTHPPERLPPNTKIIDIYNRKDINGRLLILGDVGNGKTTTLLKLAQNLIASASEDSDLPMPVLLNLSSWKNDEQSIEEWIINNRRFRSLKKYGISKHIIQQWLKEKKLIPLLDGLDEVDPQRQKLCINKINEFIESYPLCPLVVCSRLKFLFRELFM